MAPCKFFAQGNCRYGNNCRFDHVLPGNSNQGSSNRFAPLQNQNNSRNDTRPGTFNRQGAYSRELPFGLDKDVIVTDLTNERPQWILSAYGPGRAAPAQLFGGPQREQSFEEMRVAHYLAVASGSPQQAIQQANESYNAAEQQIQNALGNMDGGIDYIIKAQHEHPNRVDIVSQSTTGPQTGVFSKSAATQTSNPFGTAASQTTSTPFGNPSQPSAFGQPLQPSAFGQPSQPSAFGAPSQPSTFGAPSQPGSFGQPSALGQRAKPFGAPSAPAFGAPSQPGNSLSTFGQSSSLGQNPNPFGSAPQTTGNAFGSAAQAPSAFGAPSQLGSKPNPFASTTTAPTTTTIAANPFGSQQASTPAAPSSFGQNGSSQNPFGASSLSSQPNRFGTTAPNPFDHPSNAPANPFGTSNNISANSFGAPTSKAPPTSNPFQQVNGSGPSGYEPVAGEDPAAYTTKDMTGRLTTFKGRRVQYKDNEPGYLAADGTWCRIFFPNGPPGHTSQTTTDPVDQYDAATEAMYKQLLETGTFPAGGIPLLPPKKDWLRWDF